MMQLKREPYLSPGINDSGVFPRNLSVRWKFAADTHFTSASYFFRTSISLPISFFIGSGISIAIKHLRSIVYTCRENPALTRVSVHRAEVLVLFATE